MFSDLVAVQQNDSIELFAIEKTGGGVVIWDWELGEWKPYKK